MIKQLLDQLAEFYFQKDAINLRKQEVIDGVMTAEIKEKLAEIESEFAIQSEGVDRNIADLTEKVKAAVIENGESVKGASLHAVYSKGRVSWDTKKLEGIMMVIPQIKDARKEGDPSVTIRRI